MPDPAKSAADSPKALAARLRMATAHAHTADAERAEARADLLTEQAARLRAEAHTARVHAEAVTAYASVAEVRRFCHLTIAATSRVQAREQAEDTLKVLDAIVGTDPLPGDSAWGTVWLEGNWRYLTSKMSTPEREHAADAVARWSAALHADDPDIEPAEPDGLRWWRQ